MNTKESSLYGEAAIYINNTLVTNAMSMTIRVAIESFAADLALNGLGNDEHGIRMCELYLVRIAEIRRLMYGANSGEAR